MTTKVHATSQRVDSTLTANNRSTLAVYFALFPTISPSVLRSRIKKLGLKFAAASKEITGPLVH